MIELLSDKYNDGEWSKARFISFVKSALRSASMRWPPKHKVKKDARLRRGIYLCNGCKQEVEASKKIGDKRYDNIFIDHINPVVHPSHGFTTWDTFINRLFVDSDGLQLLCKNCHDKKTEEERRMSGSI